MPPFKMVHAEDDEQEFTEVVGSQDLRETFKEHGRVRGSFSINGYEYRNFEANSPSSVVSQINAARGATGVKASLDDGGKLVLEQNSSMPIRIMQGAPYEEPAPAGGGTIAEQVARGVKTAEQSKQTQGEGEKPKNSILEQMGLEASEEAAGAPAVVGGVETGPSAEERQKRREEEKKGNYAGQQAAAGRVDYASNPTAPILPPGSSPGRLPDGRGRTGGGKGYSADPDGSPAVQGTPANDGMTQAGPQASVPHENPSNSAV